ncbi:M23 family peptidase [Alteromonas aestuariivivens]|uniref:M23 family peptidase n=2 Tax=Alteromonas aestuariivivens TaxID=1938339 RepID=A0A3D8M5V7_9ALTE|nr:M23 family peptidase [Alteromonas aestuariivivens]
MLLAGLCIGCKAHASGCFDDWFCIEIHPHKEGHQVELRRVAPFPVVVTVLSSALEPTHIFTAALNTDKAYVLGHTVSPRAFWQTMRVRWTGGVLNATHNNAVKYRYPLQPKEQYRIVQGFNGGYSHQGRSRFSVDIAAPVGTPVYAARAGTVIDVVESHRQGGPSRRYAPYANYIIILHDDGTTGEYFHLKNQGAEVERGDQVTIGQLIGYSGNTGFSSLPHLHFGVYRAKPNGSYESVAFDFTK